MRKFVSLLIMFLLFNPTFTLAADKFTENDFKWEPLTDHYKRIIIAGVNKIARTNPDCARLDPASLQYAGGTPDDPEFEVACGEPGHIIHAHFSKTDVTGDPASDIPLEE